MRLGISAVIATIWVLVACGPVSPPSATEAMRTPTSTATATVVPTVASTTRPTVTSTPVATYTPATPNGTYQLRAWSADAADLLIEQVSSDLIAIAGDPIYQSTYGWAWYMEKFKYLALAEQEALLRFPNAAQAATWRWDLCYNLAFSSYAPIADAPELECYASLLTDGLNSGQIDIKNLPQWFASHEPTVTIEVTSQTPPPGFSSSYVVRLEYGAVLWLVESHGEYQTTGLLSTMFYFREAGINHQWLQLTGDGYPELILYVSTSTCCGFFSNHYIYELSSGHPKLLTLENADGMMDHISSDGDSYVTKLETGTGRPGFVFEGHYGGDRYMQQCTLREYGQYLWNGDRFELTESWLGMNAPTQYDEQELCQFILDTATEQGELEAAIQEIGRYRPDHPVISHEQILYRLGEYQARVGNLEEAWEYFTEVVSMGSSIETAQPWVGAAQLFLNKFQAPEDFYRACSAVPQCDVRSAFEQEVIHIKPAAFLSIPESLRASGVVIRSSGFADFDRNGSMEQWLVMQNPHSSQREFWIVVNTPDQLQAFFVSEVPTNNPGLMEIQDTNEYALITSSGESLIVLEQLELSGQFYVLEHEYLDDSDRVDAEYVQQTLIEEPLNTLTWDLLRGGDPAAIQAELLQLQQADLLNCRRPNICDRIQYLLALTYELAGDARTAAEIYTRLWQDYPDSLYAVMARSKLEVIQ